MFFPLQILLDLLKLLLALGWGHVPALLQHFQAENLEMLDRDHSNMTSRKYVGGGLTLL